MHGQRLLAAHSIPSTYRNRSAKVVVSGSKAESDRRYQMHRLDGRFVFGWMALSSFFVLKPTMLVVVSRGQLA